MSSEETIKPPVLVNPVIVAESAFIVPVTVAPYNVVPNLILLLKRRLTPKFY